MSMRCVAKWKDGHANIPADGMREENGMVYVTRDGELVGVFDLGLVEAIYLSGGNDNG